MVATRAPKWAEGRPALQARLRYHRADTVLLHRKADGYEKTTIYLWDGGGEVHGLFFVSDVGAVDWLRSFSLRRPRLRIDRMVRLKDGLPVKHKLTVKELTTGDIV